jgi:hypothetical protein
MIRGESRLSARGPQIDAVESEVGEVGFVGCVTPNRYVPANHVYW